MGQVGFGDDSAVMSKVKDYLELAGTPTVILSPSFFRDYKCFEFCGACCRHSDISLEYVKDSDRWRGFLENHPEEASFFYEVSDEKSGTIIMRYRQEKNPVKHKCQFLSEENGYCGIHNHAPFPCKFAFSKFKDFRPSKGLARLTTEGYGRAWSFTRIDGMTKGAACYMIGFNYEKLLIDLENLKELREMGKKLQIPSKLKYIIEFIEDNLEFYKTIPHDAIVNNYINPVTFEQENVL